MENHGYFYEVVAEHSRQFQAILLLRELKANNWNRKKTAKELGMSYRSLIAKVKELKLKKSESD